jgi:hypothetical protein
MQLSTNSTEKAAYLVPRDISSLADTGHVGIPDRQRPGRNRGAILEN